VKLILSGHSGSKKILGASSFLVSKYLAYAFHGGCEVSWLNYGPFDVGRLYTGTYVSLAESQSSVNAWAGDLRNYFLSLADEFIIFALDDYLLAEYMRWQQQYHALLLRMELNANIVCARLCTSEFYRPYEFEILGPDNVAYTWGDIIQLSNKAEYSATTQYSIWRREFLNELLGQVSTPWEFEIKGSRYLNASGRKVIGTRPPALVYPDSSSLSKRWNGVNVQGVRPEDVTTLLGLGLLNRADLINL
jgi:hypothetical protein